jgi:hypothetical protein
MADAVTAAGFDSAGQNAMQSFIDGVNSKVPELLTKMTGIGHQLTSALQSGIGRVSIPVDVIMNGPGLACGLDYVPYDEFPAVLHKGEAVLTATEAAAWRAGKASEGATTPEPTQQTSTRSGITIVQNISAVPQTPVEFAAATEAYFEQARWSMA